MKVIFTPYLCYKAGVVNSGQEGCGVRVWEGVSTQGVHQEGCGGRVCPLRVSVKRVVVGGCVDGLLSLPRRRGWRG